VSKFLCTVAVVLTGVACPGASAAAPPASKELDRLWADLGADDPVKVDQAMTTLVARPAQTLAFLRQRLRPAATADPRRLAEWLSALDSNKFAVREKATQELEKLREVIEPDLNKALGRGPSAEARRRIEGLLEKEKGDRLFPPAERVRSVRAIEVLERIGDGEARRLLATLAGGAPNASLTLEARTALERLTQQENLQLPR
jgi:hypothetical protein